MCLISILFAYHTVWTHFYVLLGLNTQLNSRVLFCQSGLDEHNPVCFNLQDGKKGKNGV